MLIPSARLIVRGKLASLSRRVNANSQPTLRRAEGAHKLIKKGEC